MSPTDETPAAGGDHTWVTDEHGNRVWTHQLWTMKVWSWSKPGNLDVDISHTDTDYELTIDTEDGTLDVLGCSRSSDGYESYDMPVTVPIPFAVLREILRLVDENAKAPEVSP
jgi:hypothetical protein